MPDKYLNELNFYKVLFSEKHGQFSWREVAREFGHGIHPSMARMISRGYSPGNRIREQLRLPPMEKVPVCEKCGVVHITKRCKRKSKPRPPRIAIRLDNPESAARSILAHMDAGKVDELVRLLNE